MKRLSSTLSIILLVSPILTFSASLKNEEELERISKEIYKASLDLALLGYVDEASATAKIALSLSPNKDVGSHKYNRLQNKDANNAPQPTRAREPSDVK